MGKQVVQAVKGTRDFYPEDMAFRNWLYGKIKEVSEKFGYQEFDGPALEYLDLYADKTNPEILKEQAFSLKDRDNKTLLLRPEITPTFARMVAQRSQQLPKPIRWYSFGRAWRYEQPQKGRGREFFQWEINLLGIENPAADAEILALATEFFKQIGLSPDEVVIRVSDRSYFNQIMDQNNIPQEKYMKVHQIVDRKEKITAEEFYQALKDEELNENQIEGLNKFFDNKDYTGSPWLIEVFESLKKYPGALDYIVFDPTMTRGFQYYTRTVFEAWDKTGGLKRALFGGGRFDNLTAQIGGERVPGVGMAPGDMPIQVLLEQLNKMPKVSPKTAKVLVTIFEPSLYTKSLEVANQLRSQDVDTELWLDPESKLDKQLKYADQKGIPYVLIIGPEEAEKDLVTLKNLANKTQETLKIEAAIDTIKR